MGHIEYLTTLIIPMTGKDGEHSMRTSNMILNLVDLTDGERPHGGSHIGDASNRATGDPDITHVYIGSCQPSAARLIC